MVEPVKIEGLAEFARNLRKLDSEAPKALRVALNKAAQLIVDDAKPKVPVRSGAAARSMRVASTRTKTRIRAGGKRAPYYPWLDFGGTVGRGRVGRAGERRHVEGSVKRPFLKEGRYIYKSFGDLRKNGRFEEVLSDALVDVVRSVGIEVD